ncbi:MAG: tRNA epoxyqueuosine(34) reductase QueG [bacterium]
MAITSDLVKRLATSVGFDLCGIARAEFVKVADDNLREWLHRGFQADMDWMTRNADRRVDASKLFDGAKSVIVLGLNYYQENSPQIPPGQGRISRYARGRDYHKIIGKMMKQLSIGIESVVDQEAKRQDRPILKQWVDYGPLLERPYAVKAGLGYIGRNSSLINKRFGSWTLLGEIVTSLDLEPDSSWPGEHGRCGTCRRCIDACPTGAIVEGGRTIDARKCLSYLTIEHRGEIPTEAARAMARGLFGCDICQEVCPHNLERQQVTSRVLLQNWAGVGEFVDCQQVLNVDDASFLKLAAGTVLMRAKRHGLQRNARIVLANLHSNVGSEEED